MSVGIEPAMGRCDYCHMAATRVGIDFAHCDQHALESIELELRKLKEQCWEVVEWAERTLDADEAHFQAGKRIIEAHAYLKPRVAKLRERISERSRKAGSAT